MIGVLREGRKEAVAYTDDVFQVFISHKQDDHALAVEVKKALEGLARSKLIDCFVSGIDITAGMDWRREIRSVLAKSHLLMLLFTAPSRNWDWCLYETGLYTRFDKPKRTTSAQSCACSTPLKPRRARSPTCRACPPIPTSSVPSSTLSATRHGRSPTTGAKGRWRPISTPRRLTPRLTPSRGHSAVRVRSRRTSPAIAWCCRCPNPTKSKMGFPRPHG